MTLRILSWQRLLFSLLISSFLLGGADTTDIDLDAIAVAGVRGAEAEDEALEHLYYRKSMKKLSKVDLESALGKLLKKKSKTKDPLALEKINGYILQIRRKLNKY